MEPSGSVPSNGTGPIKKSTPPPGIWLSKQPGPGEIQSPPPGLESQAGQEAVREGIEGVSDAVFKPRRPAPPAPSHPSVGPTAESSSKSTANTEEYIPKRAAPTPPPQPAMGLSPTHGTPSLFLSPNNSPPPLKMNIIANNGPSSNREADNQADHKKPIWQPINASSPRSPSINTEANYPSPTSTVRTASTTPTSSTARAMDKSKWPPPSNVKESNQKSSNERSLSPSALPTGAKQKTPPPGIVAANPVVGKEVVPPSTLPGAVGVNGPVPPPPAVPAPISPSSSSVKTAFRTAVPDSTNPFEGLEEHVAAFSLPQAAPVPVQQVTLAATKSSSFSASSKPLPPPPPPPRRTSSGDSAIKVVQWDFDGSKTPGGLSVKQGDKVQVVSSDALWCSVFLVGDGIGAEKTKVQAGLVPKSYLADPQMRKRALERMPQRPAIFDYGKESAFARDLIAVRSKDGQFGPITLPVVRFWGSSAKREHVGDRVQVFVDGKPRSELRMGEAGVPVFAQSALFSWDLKSLAPQALEDDASTLHVRFEHVCPELAGSGDSPARFAECTLFVWNYDDDVVVSDVDGTITLSDVGGHLNTTLLQKAGFLYLTARPLNLCVETRNYLRGLKQDGKLVPLGPCVTDATSYYGSLRREVVDRSSHLFKAEFLSKELRQCFIDAGRDVAAKPVFMAGFGNKDTDAMAYRTAGVHPVLTFIIDKRSVVTAGAGYASDLSSYDDPNLLSWISDMMKLFQNGKLPATPV